MKPIAFLAGLLLALLVAAPASAQPEPDRNCRDDRGEDRCGEAARAAMRALYGVPSIEQHREAGDQVRRAFYVDGYGRDLVLISFIRAPARDPTLWVHFPRGEGEPAPEPLSAPVPHQLWSEMLDRSENFDREMVPLPRDPEAIHICMHSWVFTVEATDPPNDAVVSVGPRSEVEDGCEDGLAAVYAWELARLALPLLPHCARLEPGQHRAPASQLAACRMLSGDRMAAAEVYNQLDRFRRVRGADDEDEIAAMFDFSAAAIDWQGEVHRGRGAAAFWARKIDETDANLYYRSVEGLTARRARFTGTLERNRRVEGEEEIHERAPVEMVWALGSAHVFQVETATVGPWERYTYD